ncbi:hypothetical protein MMC24_005574 [Lignoscripta atroalba]|nr:hypothetical protein [Lignoscripta atroalba]
MNAFELQSIADDPEAPPPLSAPTNAPRLSLPFQYRLPTATAGAFFTGMFLGLTHGSQTAGLRFRAENSHRLPKSSTGWYLYHKSKNYHMMLGGVKEGLKMGTKVGFWVGGFFTVEEAIDRARGGRKDFLSTVVAGLSVAGGFSAWNQFPLITAARTAKVGLISGLAFGLIQDILSLAKGRRLFYVDFLLGTNRRAKHRIE